MSCVLNKICKFHLTQNRYLLCCCLLFVKVAFEKYSKVLCTVCNCFQIQRIHIDNLQIYFFDIIKNSFEIQLPKQTNHNLLIQSSAFFILQFLDVKCIHQKKNSLAEFYIQFCCCDKQMQYPYNYVFFFFDNKNSYPVPNF